MDRWAVRENQPDAGAWMSQDRGKDRGRKERGRQRRAAGPRAPPPPPGGSPPPRARAPLRAPGASLRPRACPTTPEERLKTFRRRLASREPFMDTGPYTAVRLV